MGVKWSNSKLDPVTSSWVLASFTKGHATFETETVWNLYIHEHSKKYSVSDMNIFETFSWESVKFKDIIAQGTQGMKWNEMESWKQMISLPNIVGDTVI